MNFVLTLIAAKHDLSAGHLAAAERYLEQGRLGFTGDIEWLDKHCAARLVLAHCPDRAQTEALRDLFSEDRIDVLVTPAAKRQKKLLIADMDSTIVTGETLDDMARLAGFADQVVPVTEAAMRGEIDFEEALRRRVALLAGQPATLVDEVLSGTSLRKGAEALVKTMRSAGARCVLVSGGFTVVTQAIAQRAGFDHHHGNILEISDGVLTGQVKEPILGKALKQEILERYRQDLGLEYDDILALGDGANDLPMLERAGLGIGCYPKPLLKERLDNFFIYNDLRAALYVQGYKHLI